MEPERETPEKRDWVDVIGEPIDRAVMGLFYAIRRLVLAIARLVSGKRVKKAGVPREPGAPEEGHGFMKTVLKILKGIIEAFNIIAVAALIAMVLLVCANVVMRKIFNNPIPGTYELTQMLMICLSPCIAVNIMCKQCVWVDVVTARFGRTGQMIVDILTLPASCAIIGVIAWQGYEMIWKSIAGNAYSPIMNFRLYEWPFRLVFFLAMTVAALAALCFTIERFQEYRGGGMPHDKNEVDRAIEEAGDLSAAGAEENAEGGAVQ